MLHTFQSKIELSSKIAEIIQNKALEIANYGGVQSEKAREVAQEAAKIVLSELNKEQSQELNRFLSKESCVIIFSGLNPNINNNDYPENLPSMSDLENDITCLTLAATNQILLELSQQFAFAYDIDNYGKIMRLVGNFKGGGVTKLNNEKIENVDKSSHSGIALTAHTEAPYHSASRVFENHSPAPSTLVLTARWNPLSEPTTVIPIKPILEQLSFEEVLALSTNNFDFSRSETFTEGKGTGGEKVSIIEIDNDGKFCIKYNSYRFTPNKEAPEFVINAFNKFATLVQNANSYKINLQPDTTMIINNTLALHCRDIIKDNRRLLIRLFGYSNNISCISLRKNPPLVQG